MIQSVKRLRLYKSATKSCWTLQKRGNAQQMFCSARQHLRQHLEQADRKGVNADEMTEIFLGLVACVLAFVVGMATQRTNLCVVLAGHDLVERRDARRFAGFFMCGLAALALLAAAHLAGLFDINRLKAYRVTDAALIGGAVFGLGAVINGGCSFGAMTALARGSLRMFTVLPAMVAGAMLVRSLSPGAMPVADGSSLMTRTGAPLSLTLVATILLLLLLMVVLKPQFQPPRPGIWPPALALLLIGVINALMLPLVPDWSFSPMLVDAARGDFARAPLRLILFAAFLGGALFAAWRDSRLRWRRPRLLGLVRSGIGGLAMGAGAVMVPGGNDALLLQGIPALSPHALPAYLAMLGTVVILVLLLNRLNQHLQPTSA